ncbi:MAG: hypothetical protein ACXACY_10275 [Candidatus Hodarchaeales archaeon]|jgi:hypothetical protein
MTTSKFDIAILLILGISIGINIGMFVYPPEKIISENVYSPTIRPDNEFFDSIENPKCLGCYINQTEFSDLHLFKNAIFSITFYNLEINQTYFVIFPETVFFFIGQNIEQTFFAKSIEDNATIMFFEHFSTNFVIELTGIFTYDDLVLLDQIELQFEDSY